MEYKQDRAGKHWGDYRWEDHGYDSLAADPTMDVSIVTGVEQAANYQTLSGLAVVPSAVRSPLVQSLTATKLQVTSTGDPISAQAVPANNGEINTWLSDFVKRGYVVMLNKQHASQGHALLKVSANPLTIANLSKVGAGWVIVDGPWAVINRAQQTIPITPMPLPGTTPKYTPSITAARTVSGQAPSQQSPLQVLQKPEGGWQPLAPSTPVDTQAAQSLVGQAPSEWLASNWMFVAGGALALGIGLYLLQAK